MRSSVTKSSLLLVGKGFRRPFLSLNYQIQERTDVIGSSQFISPHWINLKLFLTNQNRSMLIPKVDYIGILCVFNDACTHDVVHRALGTRLRATIRKPKFWLRLEDKHRPSIWLRDFKAPIGQHPKLFGIPPLSSLNTPRRDYAAAFSVCFQICRTRLLTCGLWLCKLLISDVYRPSWSPLLKVCNEP